MKGPLIDLTAKILGMFVAFALALFLSAGTVVWPAGWAFLALFFGFVVSLSLWLLRNNPDLLAERLTGVGRADQKAWDKFFFAITLVLFFGWLVLMALDAIRFHWSEMPLWLQIVGALILVGSFCLFFLTFRENSYLSPIVRVQTERGHRVVTTGPYHYVRHPMYAAFVAYVLGVMLLLGSWYGSFVALLLFIAMARRAVLEERMLRTELHGYEAYMTAVRYRLVPYVW